MTSKINRPWERPPKGAPHSPPGIDALRVNTKTGLMKFYAGIAESMWRYDGLDTEPRFRDMLQMSRDTVPEKFLFRNGECCVFAVGDQLHILPVTYEGGINIYGHIANWHPVPVGWSDDRRASYSREMAEIRDMHLDPTNSVILRNDLFGSSDLNFIEQMVDELVDNVLTVNQLQLLASSPYVFNVSEDNVLTAKNYFLALAERRAAIFTNALGEKAVPVVEQTGIRIDPAIFEIYDRWECMLLENLGFPCVPITKRAQQTVSEVQSNDDKIRMKRQEKLLQRQRDWQRVNAMFGTDIRVVSLIDEYATEDEDREVQGDAERMPLRSQGVSEDPRTRRAHTQHGAQSESYHGDALFHRRGRLGDIGSIDTMSELDYMRYFGEGAAPWIPRLVDIEYRKSQGESAYEGIGFDQLDVDSTLEELTSRLDTLNTRFLERYNQRMINSETLERWQVRLQNRFDEIADRYERAYQLYADNGEAMLEDILPGWQEVMDRTDADSGTDTRTRTGNETLGYAGSEAVVTDDDGSATQRDINTPDAAANASDSYADARRDSTDSRDITETRSFTNRVDTRTYNSVADALVHGKATDIDWTRTHIETGSQIIDAVNDAITKWRDLDTQFVAEFENLFLNIFWYRGDTMTRASLEEQYNNKDVLTQIYAIRDAINDINEGVIESMTLDEDDGTYTLTVTYADGTSQTFSWDVNTVNISDVSMTYASGVYTLVFEFSDGSTKSFVLNIGDIVTTDDLQTTLEDYYTSSETDNLLADKADDDSVVHLTGAETVAGVKTLSNYGAGIVRDSFLMAPGVIGYYKVLSWSMTSYRKLIVELNSGVHCGKLVIGYTNMSTMYATWVYRATIGTNIEAYVCSDNTMVYLIIYQPYTWSRGNLVIRYESDDGTLMSTSQMVSVVYDGTTESLPTTTTYPGGVVQVS